MAINTQKFLPQGKGGGSLAVRPKTNLAPIKKQSSSLTKIDGKQEDPMLVIKTKVIKIEDILKGTLAAEKKAADDKRKVQEQEDRSKQEQDLETPKVKGKGIKIPVPKKIKSWWENIKSFFTNVLLGWLTVRLIDWLPKLMPILKFLAATADFIINWGGKILNGLVTFVDWGYKAVDATQTWIGDKFGEDAAKKFESFMSGLNLVMNGVIALGLAAAAMAGRRGPGGPRGPRRGPINQLKRLRTKVRRFINPNADAIKRAKRLKEITKQRKIAENALKRQRLLRRIRPTNVRRTAQVALEKTGRFFQGKPKPGPGLFGQMKSGLGSLWQGTKGIVTSGWNFTTKQGSNFAKWANTSWKGFANNLDNIISGISAQGAKWAQQVGDVVDMARNPAKLIEKVKGILSGQLDDIVKKNKTVAKLLNLAKNPGKLIKDIGNLLNQAKKSKGLLQIRNALKGAQKMKIGGIDKVIAAIMGLLDYAAFGESPINAILRALGGLLGYSAGFAIGAPFGGAPGFITGMAGAFVGEQAARLLAKGLVHMPTPWGELGMVDDPIAKGLGLSPRKMVRDPDDLGMNEELEKAQLEHGFGDDEKFLPLDVDSVSKKANGVSEYASYEDGSVEEVVVVNKQSSKVNNNTTNEGQIIAVNTGGGDSSDPYALNYRG